MGGRKTTICKDCGVVTANLGKHLRRKRCYAQHERNPDRQKFISKKKV